MNNAIIELAFLRNQLINENINEADMQLLEKIKKEILSSNSPFNELAFNAINNCEEYIKNNNFKKAAQEIQLIHNFPFKNKQMWNSDYFYKIELRSYFENTNDVTKIKKIIILLAELQKKMA